MNRFILGYATVSEAVTSCLASGAHLLGMVYGTVAGFILMSAGYVYDPKEAVYFLTVLMLIDWLTGLLKAFLTKTFVSYKLPRMSLNILVMLAVLACFFNGAKYFEPIGWLQLPTIVYGGFVTASLASVVENLHTAKLIPAPLYKVVSKLLNFQAMLEKFGSLIGKKADEKIEDNEVGDNS